MARRTLGTVHAKATRVRKSQGGEGSGLRKLLSGSGFRRYSARAPSAGLLPLVGREEVQAITDPLQRLGQRVQRQILTLSQEAAQCVVGEADRLAERAPRLAVSTMSSPPSSPQP